jgi:hypothetical protein
MNYTFGWTSEQICDEMNCGGASLKFCRSEIDDNVMWSRHKRMSSFFSVGNGGKELRDDQCGVGERKMMILVTPTFQFWSDLAGTWIYTDLEGQVACVLLSISFLKFSALIKDWPTVFKGEMVRHEIECYWPSCLSFTC